MTRMRIFLILAVAAAPPAQSQAISSESLRGLFRLDRLDYDPGRAHLRATWPFEKEAELRAFDRLGRPATLDGEGAIRIDDRSGLRLREINLRPPCRIALDVKLARKSSILELSLSPPGLEVSGVVAFLNRPIHVDDGLARRHDGVVELTHGLRGDAAGAAPSALSHEEGRRVVVDVKQGSVRLTVAGSTPREAEIDVPDSFGLALVSPRGGVELSSLEVDGQVAELSLRKLLRAGLSARKDERGDGPATLGAVGVEWRLINEERSDTLAVIRKEIRAGRLRARGATLTKSERAGVIRAIGLRRRTTRADALRDLIRKHEHETYLSYLLAEELRRERKDADAAATLERLVARAMRAPEAWRALAIHHLEQDDEERALECLEKARKQGPGQPWTLALRALVHMRRGEFERASSLVRSARSRKRKSVAIRSLERYLRILSKGPFVGGGAELKTDRYVIESNLESGELEWLSGLLGRYRRFLEQALPLPVQETTPSRVWLFDSKEEYLSFTETMSLRAEHTLGVYHPSLNTLLLFSSMSREQNQGVLFHEAFHQYLDIAVQNAPLWFNEGMAEYFGATEFDDRGAGVKGGLQPGRLATLRTHLQDGEKVVPFKQLMLESRRAFMSGDVGLHYAQSWSMIHFFLEGDDAAAARLFQRYTAAILERKGAAKAFDGTFGKLSRRELDAMQARWRRYVESKLVPRLKEDEDAEGKEIER